MEYGVRPLSMMTKHVNRQVRVVLKNEIAYSGVVVEVDGYMNLVLEKATEYRDADRRAGYPYILIRGNNIMYIQLEGV